MASKGHLFCLSWKWRKRSSVKITERTHEEAAEALHASKAAPIVDGHKAEVPDYGPAIPESSLNDPRLAIAPTLQNTGDSSCLGKENVLHTCTDEEIVEAQAELQTQWNSYPEWLRKKCVSFTTLKSIASEASVMHDYIGVELQGARKPPVSALPVPGPVFTLA